VAHVKKEFHANTFEQTARYKSISSIRRI